MSARLTQDEVNAIKAGIRAGKLASIIAMETGRSYETIRYIAAKYRLNISLAYVKRSQATYWPNHFKRRAIQAVEGNDIDAMNDHQFTSLNAS